MNIFEQHLTPLSTQNVLIRCVNVLIDNKVMTWYLPAAASYSLFLVNQLTPTARSHPQTYFNDLDIDHVVSQSFPENWYL